MIYRKNFVPLHPNCTTMRHLCILSILVLMVSCSSFTIDNQLGQDLERLDKAIASRGQYDAVKRQRIDSLQQALYLSDEPYFTYENLYEEYRSYNYDTALYFVQAMQREALQKGNSRWQTDAAIRQAFVYLSGGLFHEAYESLASIPVSESLPDAYLLTYARLLYDMSDYASGTVIAEQYNSRGNALMAEWATRYTPADSALYWYPLAVIDLRNKDYDRSIARMKETMLCSRCTAHDLAICTSSLGHLYRMKGDHQSALHYYIKAAIYDAQSSTYETIALRMVAEILYGQGDVERADRYIHIAMGDAQRYHARHRQVSISQLLPIIEQKYSEQFKQRTLTAYILLISVLILLFAGTVEIILLIRRHRTIHAAHETIDTINRQLTEANSVKEQMLGSLLTGISKYLSAMEKYQSELKDNVVHRRLNELMHIPKNLDAKFQRQQLNHRIDQLVLSIFPGFVVEFNALLPEDHKMEIKPGELLNPPLRIFALIRLGITHNEVIAQILDYSINTVYTYKTRTISQSLYEPDAFYDALMHIASPMPDVSELNKR